MNIQLYRCKYFDGLKKENYIEGLLTKELFDAVSKLDDSLLKLNFDKLSKLKYNTTNKTDVLVFNIKDNNSYIWMYYKDFKDCHDVNL